MIIRTDGRAAPEGGRQIGKLDERGRAAGREESE